MQDALQAAIALKNGGKLDEAASALRVILGKDSKNCDALRNLGLIEVSQGRAEGVQLIEKAIELNPGHILTYHDLGMAFYFLKRWPEALDCLERIVQHYPEHAHAHFLCGVIFFKQKRIKQAVAALTRSIQLKPDLGEAHLVLGNLCQSEGKLSAAEKRFRAFLQLQPDDERGYIRLSVCLNDSERSEEARAILQKGHERLPAAAGILNSLGNTYKKLGLFDESEASYRASMALDPEQANCYSNLGSLLQDIPGREAEAEACHRKACELGPELWEVYSNLGNFLRMTHRLEEAEATLRQALARDPENFEVRTTLGLVLLSRGHLADAFREYGFRWKKAEKRAVLQAFRLADRPMWDGCSVAGKTLFIWPEQGNGDYLQFLRYVPLLAEQGARVILGAKKGLEALAQSVDGVAEVVDFKGPVAPNLHFDYHCPVVNLGECFKTDLHSIPVPIPYLFPSAERVSAWRRSLVGIRKKRIGLVWAGNPNHAFDRRRSISLAMLAPVLDMKGVQHYSLQVGANSSDVEEFPAGKIIDLSSNLINYEETAAAIQNLDLVVSVDTSVAHLAGAMNKPVWMLLSSAPSLMWMRDREDSPWYPSMRIFRQADGEEWEPVIERLTEALRGRFRNEMSGVSVTGKE